MQAFDLAEIATERARTSDRYLEFLRTESMSCGLYVLSAGDADGQRPHTEDEVYVVRRGRASIEVAGERRAVGEGSVIFVGRQVEHRFVDIVEDLEVIVLFAPAEGSAAEH